MAPEPVAGPGEPALTDVALERQDAAGPRRPAPTGEGSSSGAGPAPAGATWAGRAARRIRRLSLSSWFVILALGFGTFLVFAQPPGQGLDEMNHFYRAWTLAHGTLVAPITDKRAGAQVPACISAYFAHFSTVAAGRAPFSFGDYWHSIAHCPSGSVWVPFENTAVNGPVSYAPHVVAIAVLSGLGAPLPVVFFGGRLASLLVYVAIFFLAIRITPVGKHVMVVLGLLPTTLLLAAGYSADPMAISLAVLAVALTLRCCVSASASWRTFACLVGVLAAMALTKNTYFILAPLLLLVPNAVTGKWRHPLLVKLGAMVVVVALAGMWYLAIRHVSLAAYRPAGPQFPIDEAAQRRFILHHPVAYVKVLARTIFDNTSEAQIIPGFFSSVGYYRPAVGDQPFAPFGIVIVGSVTLWYAFWLQLGARRLLHGARRVFAWVPVVLALAGALIVMTTFWIYWTPVRQLVVVGLQGRYFVPFVALPLVTIGLLRQPRIVRHANRWVLAGSTSMLVWLVVKIFVHDYGL